MYVYTPEYKYNLSCASLQLLWRLDTYVLVCGRTRRLSLSRSLSLARARSHVLAHTHTHKPHAQTHPHPRTHTHTHTHKHTHTCTRAHRCTCVCMVYRQQSTYSHTCPPWHVRVCVCTCESPMAHARVNVCITGSRRCRSGRAGRWPHRWPASPLVLLLGQVEETRRYGLGLALRLCVCVGGGGIT